MNDAQILELTTAIIFALKPHFDLDQAIAAAAAVRSKTRPDIAKAREQAADFAERQRAADAVGKKDTGGVPAGAAGENKG